MPLNETDWFDNPREVAEFYWWLIAQGYIANVDDAGRYFENPENWVLHAGQWIRDKYESRPVVAL